MNLERTGAVNDGVGEPDPEQAVSGPAGHAPLRRPGSVRRTATMDMTWPGGLGTQLRIDGNARDLVTPIDGAPFVVATASCSVGIGPMRTIEDIIVEPVHAGIEQIIGSRGGGHLRGVLDRVIHEDRQEGTPLYLLLDDISGCSLIAGFAWSRWRELWMSPPEDAPTSPLIEAAPDAPLSPAPPSGPPPSMEGVCIGFAPGSSALVEVRSGTSTHRLGVIPSLLHPDDPDGWHHLPNLPPVSMRRARRIDVWREGDTILIDAAFQDSAGDPDFGRLAIHEYRLAATADAATMTLTSVSPDPRVLPFIECPLAVTTSGRVVGTPLAELRLAVPEKLHSTNGCTHLNDALRALAEVPVLLGHLSG
jgi:hypothetical protein